ncbi:MAG: segregation and condensation protein A [Candidatus Brocadiia bacterium]
MPDAEDPHYGYKVALETFSGPLDLLLYLIRQQEVDIADIPIAEITDQYLRHLEILREVNVDLAGEFLVMAATLMEIKSRMLLPRHEEDEEEEEDPRADLIRQLMEYKRFKDAARHLARQAEEQALKFPRGAAAALGLPEKEPQDDLPLVLGEVTVWDLVSAFRVILRQTSLETTQHIAVDRTPASAHCNELLERLRGRASVTFGELFDPAAGRAAVIGVFLALLELIRRRRVRAEQAGEQGEIRVFLLDDTPVSEDELVAQSPHDQAPPPDEGPADEPPQDDDEQALPDDEVDRIDVPDVEPPTDRPSP